MHAAGDYGQASAAYAGKVSELCQKAKAKAVIDYGCGSKQTLKSLLACDAEYFGYDPAVEKFSQSPPPADVLVCIDVLEHIEPEFLDDVLDHMQTLAKRALLVSIHTGPAKKTLPDGRNAHLIQKPALWWLSKILPRWNLLQFAATKHGFGMVLHVD